MVWPAVQEAVQGAHGFVCSNCIASMLLLSSTVVTMVTFGLSRRDGFEMADGVCARCGVQRRVIRTRP
jgi:hypothetical protein